ARLPSGVMATADGCWLGASAGASATVPTTATVFPEIDKTLTLLSARLATSAKFPVRLIAMPEGCLPVWIVAMTAGGEAVREELVVRHTFESVAILDHVDRVRHQRQLAVRRDREVGRRPEDRVLKRQIDDDAWLGAIADIDDRHGILARRAQYRLAVVESDLLVIADDEILGLRRGGEAHHRGQRGCSKNP